MIQFKKKTAKSDGARQWHVAVNQMSEGIQQDETEEPTLLSQRHSSLAHYTQATWMYGQWLTLNPYMHDHVDPDVARRLGRLLAGGQKLTAGDPNIAPTVTKHNCCASCLALGMEAAETLAHSTFYCPACQHLRAGLVAGLCAAEDINMFRMHRDQWSWSELRALHKFWTGGNLLQEQLRRRIRSHGSKTHSSDC